jgi:hypothetical protein
MPNIIFKNSRLGLAFSFCIPQKSLFQLKGGGKEKKNPPKKGKRKEKKSPKEGKKIQKKKKEKAPKGKRKDKKKAPIIEIPSDDGEETKNIHEIPPVEVEENKKVSDLVALSEVSEILHGRIRSMSIFQLLNKIIAHITTYNSSLASIYDII